MLKTEFIRHVYRTARDIYKEMKARFPEYTIRDAVDAAFDGVNEYWQGA